MAEKIVKLLEPDLCLTCRFCKVAAVLYRGRQTTMLHCTRLACDNWEEEPEREPVEIINELPEIE